MPEPSLFDDPDGPGGAPTWTVAELSAHIGRVMGVTFPDDVWVEGQIRNLSRPQSGHVYFDLTEPTEGGRPPKAQLAVTLLAPEKQHVNDQITRAGGGVRISPAKGWVGSAQLAFPLKSPIPGLDDDARFLFSISKTM